MNIKEILEKHRKWLTNEADGERANLSRADLYGANLSGANLSRANLSRADLYGANLSGANLSRADLYGANLSGANLSRANLSRADLYGANLSGANLSRANLSRADLSRADLYGADLSGANLSGADLSGADLSGADLSGANPYGANLSGANIPLELVNKFYPICCPESGAFIAWKKAGGKVVKLMVEEAAKRSSAYGRKCRCSSALCLAIENLDGTDSGLTEIASDHDSAFVYRVGEVAKVDNFDEDRRNECAPGVHFFITRQEAVDY